MLIQGTSVSVTYKRIDGIKKAYYNNEEILRSFFNEATVLPVPDDAPDEIPRIVIKTLHEHATLSITPIVATFEVNYNDGFERNWDNCSSYIKERMEKVFEFLNILTRNEYEYIGIISSVLYDEISEKGAEKLSNTLLKTSQIRCLHDVSIKYTFIERDNFFINILLQNARVFKDRIPMNEAGALSAENQTAESIGAILDINDRFGYNSQSNYVSKSQNLRELLNIMSEVVNSKLQVLIEKGEY